MNVDKKSSFVFIGFVLFAMFFGSGNLIFPLDVGRIAVDGWPIAALGFMATAVFVPFLGILAMVVYRGHTGDFFSILGKTGALVVTAIVLTVWIPLGSGPRCIVLAWSSLLTTQIGVPPLWVFSLLWSVAVWFVVQRKGRMLDILGYILTPLLLGCLILTVYLGLSSNAHLNPATESPISLFSLGAIEGYNTMDLIASFFFSASIIEILRKAAHHGEYHPLQITFKAGLIGVSLLGAVYIGLISLAAYHSDVLQSVAKDQLLATVAKRILGDGFSLTAIGAIFLACFTTSVALVVVFAEFLQSWIKSEKVALFVTLVLCFLMSLTGLEGITWVTSPVLQAFYPFLIVMIVFNLGRHYLRGKCKCF